MKRIVFLLLVIPLISNGQSPIDLSSLIEPSPVKSMSKAEGQLEVFVRQLKNKKSASDLVYLKKVFHQTERNFLDHYEPYAEFRELFTSGNYDCLTATTLFSLVLDQLQFKFRIIETNYHIFLIVKTAQGEVLLETTDRFSGFVTNPKEIQQRIGTYRKETGKVSEDTEAYQYHFDLFHEVGIRQLSGLLHYNQAVKAFNQGNLELCAEFLVRAQSIYDTPRIGEFTDVLLKSLAASKLESRKKQHIADQLKMLAHKPAVLASR